jgi:alpha-1,3-rhamnosyl/mannosyltransferase
VLTVASARLGVGVDALYGSPAVVHLPAGYGPRFTRARVLVTVHDLTALTRPDWHPARTQFLVEQSMPAVVCSAAGILTDSEHVRRQVLDWWNIPPERVRTVPLPVGPAFRPVPAAEARARAARVAGVEGPFLLHVGTLEPRKHHVGLVTAFERLRRAGFPGPLVLVGRDGWRVEPILARIERSPERTAIIRVPDAEEAELAALYSSCTMFAFPSLDEGFGFPPLEALACGAACVVADRASLPEVVGVAARRVDPEDPDALADTLVALWRDADSRAALAALGPARAAGFDPATWVARMFAIYRELSGGQPLRSRDTAA